ncbi:MAG: molecular chaperone HtpG [Pelagibacterales bacterium]|nr:molecular chaperone HtpG [Pelagibacterales bacterium]
MSKENFQFQAEVGKILNIVANSLYSEKEIFLREYISNASDACDKLRYESLQNSNLSNKEDFKILVSFSKKNKTISISDNGIGMGKSELINSLGTIAKSGTEEFIKKLENKNEKNIEQIGKFGVGFYSGFMVAEKITVLSIKAGEKSGWKWSSDGKGGFDIEEDSSHKIGSIITLYLKKDAMDFLENVRLNNIIKKYSDHITHPVFLFDKDKKDYKEEQANQSLALWTKNKRDIKEEDYNNFYTQSGLNYDKPWKVLHNQNEGTINFTNLIFIPSEKPFDLLHADKKVNIKLYVKKVFITDNCENLIPKYMRFLNGIIDSEDISLNISREMLQNDPVIAKIRNNIVKKVISELEKELKNNKDNYTKFWENFGPVLKEGIHEDFTNKDTILKLSMFESSKKEGWTTLDDYIKRMSKDQKEIYYISGESKSNLLKSPQMESFITNNLEVLFFTDPIDEFWIPNIDNFNDYKFKSITKGAVDFKNKEVNKKEKENKDKSFEKLTAYLKSFYGDKVKDVRVSNRLTSSPVCFVADESSMDIHLENILKKHKHLNEISAKILEINPNHALIKFLNKIDTNDKKNLIKVKNISNMLLDQANLLEGIPLDDSKDFCNKLNDLILLSIN